MDNYGAIYNTFLDCRRRWLRAIEHCQEIGEEGVIEGLEIQDIINNHAYFCLFFFQIEVHIKSLFSALCRRRQGDSLGPDRAAWTNISQRKPDIIGMAEILLADQPELITRLKSLYRDRNAIAHEGRVTLSLEMTTVINDIETIAQELDLLFADPEAAP